MKLFLTPYFCQLLLAISLVTMSFYSFGFGTLMTTPEQRLMLNEQRKSFDTPVNHRQIADSKQTPQVIIFEGIVKRRNGPNSIWLNGQLVERTTSTGLSIDPNKTIENAIAIDLPSTGNAVWLRPGQGVALDDGNIYENYQQAAPAIVAAQASGLATSGTDTNELSGPSAAVSTGP